jgi:large subunit ribosomal protein L6
MSRIGNKSIAIPSGVKVVINGRDVSVESGDKRLAITHRPEVTVRVDGDQIIVERDNDSRTSRAMHGLTRSLIANMVEGVTKGYEKNLEVNGVGWTAKVQGMNLALNIGYADTRVVPIPAGITITVDGNKIKVSGIDKQKVGQMAAVIRAQRPPEPYNAKGIKYSDEQIQRKAGKAFAGSGA